MDASALASAESWLSAIAIAKLVAAALVAIGVAIEFGGEWIARPFERVVAAAGRQQIATLNTQTAQANERAANLETQAAALKAANLALESQIAPRRLNATQIASLVVLLKEFPGRSIRIASYELDVDAAMLGRQILAAADSAKLSPQDMRMSQGALGGMLVGVSVTGTDADLVNRLLSLFASFGMAPTPNEPPPTGGASFGGQGAPFSAKIFIGAKPLAK